MLTRFSIGKILSALTLGVAVTGCAVTPASHYDVYEDYDIHYRDAYPVYVYPSTRLHIYERHYDGYPRRPIERRHYYERHYDGYPRRPIERRHYAPHRQADRHDGDRDRDRDRDHKRDDAGHRDRDRDNDRPHAPRADESRRGPAGSPGIVGGDRRRADGEHRADGERRGAAPDRARRDDRAAAQGQSSRENDRRGDRSPRERSHKPDTRAYKDGARTHSAFTRDR